jgi:hypothetical protein
VPYTLRVVKSRFSGAVGRRVELVFDRSSCRFRQREGGDGDAAFRA